MKRQYIISAFLFLAVILLFNFTADAQCSQCKAVVESSEDGTGSNIGAGLNNGILYLMAVPYILLFLLFRKKIFKLFRELRASN